jgi:coenzyme PQQ synthesis protein D (PqqD)
MAFTLPFFHRQLNERQNGVTLDDSVRIEPHVRALIDESGAVLLDLKEGRYYSLNVLGTRIWGKLETGMTPCQIIADLQQTYQVSPERLKADVTTFLEGMAEKGLVCVRR